MIPHHLGDDPVRRGFDSGLHVRESVERNLGLGHWLHRGRSYPGSDVLDLPVLFTDWSSVESIHFQIATVFLTASLHAGAAKLESWEAARPQDQFF